MTSSANCVTSLTNFREYTDSSKLPFLTLSILRNRFFERSDEEEENDDEEEDEEEEIEVTPAGRGGRSSNIGRGVGRGGSEARLSGTKRERTF